MLVRHFFFSVLNSSLIDISALTQSEVQKRLEKVEEDYLNSGGCYPHSTTMSQFIMIGLDIEDSQ